MHGIYFEAAGIERTRRRAEAVGRLIIGDSWMRDRMSTDEVVRAHEQFAAPMPEMALWHEDQSSNGGWIAEPVAAAAVLGGFPFVGREPGWTFGTYVFRDFMGGYGRTFARRIGTQLLSREELQAMQEAGRTPEVDTACAPATILRWDPQELAGFLWASLAIRELEQLGGEWHGLGWSTESLLGGSGRPELTADAEAFSGDRAPDLDAFSYVAERPSRWDPLVRREAKGAVRVAFFTFGARNGERIWQHRDLYEPGSTLPERSRTEIARGGFGYVF